MALFGYDEKTRRMRLLEVAPGITPEDIQERVGFELIMPKEIKTMQEPAQEDLRLLREVIDPEGYFLKRKVEE